MRKSRFTNEQMVAIPREAKRDPIVSVANKHVMREQSIHVAQEDRYVSSRRRQAAAPARSDVAIQHCDLEFGKGPPQVSVGKPDPKAIALAGAEIMHLAG